jgi:hypothetical protein
MKVMFTFMAQLQGAIDPGGSLRPVQTVLPMLKTSSLKES